MKKSTVVACILIFLAAGTLSALDREIVLGRGDRWQEVSSSQNIILREGRWATADLALKEAQYTVDPRTDLLIHFDELPFQDSSGRYQVAAEDLLLSRREVAFGEGSGGFSSGKGGLHLTPRPGALFHQGTWIRDFSIEFWLYPALLSDGEQIFLWQGARWNGETVAHQELRCTVKDRTLEWVFENLFTGTMGQTTSIRLRGITGLVPRDWHHHLLRYDSRIGMLEYLVDGTPEAITYTKDSSGSVLLPFTGDAGPGELTIGQGFTGFMDELRICPAFVESPNLSRFTNEIGVFESSVFDLGYTGTSLKRIDAVFRAPGDSAVYFYFRMTDRADADTSGIPWNQFEAGRPLSDRYPAVSRGRYLQVMVELYPDGSRRLSPELSELRLVYEQDLPPAPPTGLYAEAGNGKVRLYWNPVNEEDLGGYYLYYGSQPGSYRGTDSDLGPSPIDVGQVSQFECTGLSNGRLYYFAVVAYDLTDPPHRSLFSREVSARPSGLLP
ncbi:MAG: hypothetical protein JXB06_11055 [Spirochaetales bacterium]|nr:hypothetical protein [Spirochaetales bacterium]